MGARIIDPISMLVMLGLLVYLHYSLAVRSYSLITKLPDRVARWSGASGEGLDEEHGSNEINAAVTGGIHRQAGQRPGVGWPWWWRRREHVAGHVGPHRRPPGRAQGRQRYLEAGTE